MASEHVTIKVWTETRRKLRLIAAMTERQISEVVDLLATGELDRLNRADRRADDRPTTTEPQHDAANDTRL